MRHRRVQRLKRSIRALNYHQRIELMDWLNMWYAAQKEDWLLQIMEEEI